MVAAGHHLRMSFGLLAMASIIYLILQSSWEHDSILHVLLTSNAVLLALIIAVTAVVQGRRHFRSLYWSVGLGFLFLGAGDVSHLLLGSMPYGAPGAIEGMDIDLLVSSLPRLAFSAIVLVVIFLSLENSLQALRAWRAGIVVYACLLFSFLLAPLFVRNLAAAEAFLPMELLVGAGYFLTLMALYSHRASLQEAFFFWIGQVLLLNLALQIVFLLLPLQSYGAFFAVADAVRLVSYVGLYIALISLTFKKAPDDSKSFDYGLLLNNLPYLLYCKDLKGRYLFANSAYANFLGVEVSALVGFRDEEIHSARVGGATALGEKEALSQQEVQQSTSELIWGNKRRWYESTHIPLLDAHSLPIAVLGLCRDISGQKEREIEIQARDVVVEESIAAIVLVSANGVIQSVNKSMLNIWECNAKAQLLGRRLDDSLFTASVVQKMLSRNKWQGEARSQRLDGKSLELQLSSSLIRNENEEVTGLMISCVDVTAQKEAMNALMRSEETFSKAQEIASIGSWDWDIVDGSLCWTDEIYRIFGLRPQEFGATYEAFVERVHPEDRQLVQDSVNAAVQNKGVEYSVEHRIVRPSGEERVVDEHGKVYRDHLGAPIRMIGTVLDVTERKRVEEELEVHKNDLESLVVQRTLALQDAHKELLKKERLATLGRLTGTVSHELRNPLGAMRPALYLLAKHLQGDAALSAAMERIDRNITRCDTIIDELLDFTQAPDVHAKKTNAQNWLTSVLEQYVVPDEIELNVINHLEEVELAFDPQRLRRALVNVLDNACQAMAECSDGRQLLLQVEMVMAGQRVEIRVSDTGEGIEDDLLEKIFEPLFSTKGFGVGLGMSTVKQIMEQHYGGVEVQTVLGKGTTLILWFPEKVCQDAGVAA
jgi:PAS domain S-box-containing protein